jgi:hypothetical protein
MDWMDFLSDVLQGVLVAILPVLATAATAAIAAWARKTWAEFKNENQVPAFYVEEIARIAVLAAEQAGAAGLIQDRKEYAMTVAQTWLAQRGIKLDLAIISAAIEAAVYDELKRPQA